MKNIGIIANPFSGRDIRRFTSFAFSVTNPEKENMVTRMILSAQAFGVDNIYLMPDSYKLNRNITNKVLSTHGAKNNIHIIDTYFPIDQPSDTIKAIEEMERQGVKALIVMGGDGTNRLAAKTVKNIPIIAVSTGTNNVYPTFSEGTSVGTAAAFIAQYGNDIPGIIRDKQIEIYINGKFVDIATVDALICINAFTGSKAIWKSSEIDDLIVCRTRSVAIGFSSIIGCIKSSTVEDNFGWRTVVGKGNVHIRPQFEPGKITPMFIEEPVMLEKDIPYVFKKDYNGTIALDGERTVSFKAGDEIKVVITRNGPLRAELSKVMDEAVKRGFFYVK
jgi:hypothetical protein